MKRWLKYGLYGIIVILAGIQFIPVNRNISSSTPSTDFIVLLNPPNRIADKIAASCYNCHSNNTNYPWYSYVQPVAWILQDHIDEGKEELNFSEYGNYSGRMKRMKLDLIINEIKDGEMPLSAYTLFHKEARLSGKEKKDLIDYFSSLKKQL